MQDKNEQQNELEQSMDSFAMMDDLLADMEQEMGPEDETPAAQPPIAPEEEPASPEPMQQDTQRMAVTAEEITEEPDAVDAQTTLDGMQVDEVTIAPEEEEPESPQPEVPVGDTQQLSFSQVFEPEDEDAEADEPLDASVDERKARKAMDSKRRQREQTSKRRSGNKGGILAEHTGYTAATLNLQQTLVLFGVSLILLVLSIFVKQTTASLVICLIAYLVLAIPQLVMSVRAFLHTKTISQGICVLIASLVILCLKHSQEAVVTVMLYTAGTFLTDYLIARVNLASPQDAVKLPKYACRIDRSGLEERILVQEVQKDALFFIREGEIVPADAVIRRGDGTVLRTIFETEEVSVQVQKGDAIFAGDVFLGNAMLVQATEDYENCAAVKLEAMRANCKKNASIEDSVLTNVNKYPACALVLALVIACLPPLFDFGAFSVWLYRGLTVFALGYPTALLLSVPLGFYAANMKFQENGIWVKGNGVIENAANVRMVMFDKTGILTNGQFQVKEVHVTDGFRESDCIALAATAEQHSAHPVARSIVAAYGKELPEVTEFEETPGQGVVAVAKGATLYVGNRSLMVARGVKNVPDYQGTVLYIAYENNYIGAIVMEDTVRPDVKDAVSDLKKNGILKTVLLTGDAEAAAKRAAEECGIESYHHGLVPEEKAAKVGFLLRTVPIEGTTAYVGDGIYDMPEQRIADVGITVRPQSASRLSDASDALIFSHNLNKLVKFLSISKRTHSVNVQNTLLTIVLKIMLALLTVFGVIGIGIALAVDVLVSLLLILNTLKLSR